MNIQGPASRPERQRARARRCAPAALERDYVPPPIEQILASAREQRRGRTSPGPDQAPVPEYPLPFDLTDLLPPERVLFLRVFAGTVPYCRRRAVRAWRHRSRATRERSRTDTNDPGFAGLVALSRDDAEAAVELLDDAHRTLAQAGDRHEAALSLAHHARALAADGDVQRALLEVDLATGVLREMRATYSEALTLTIRAQVLRAAGQEADADDTDAAAGALCMHANRRHAARLGNRLDATVGEPANPTRPR